MEIVWTTIGSIVVLSVAASFKMAFMLLNCKDTLKRIEDTVNSTNANVIEINTKT